MTDFKDLKLAEPLLRALGEEGYATPTPIQGKSIPALLEQRDLLGIAQTGTGKTASFALPLLHRLSLSNRKAVSNKPRALILAPTRELATQISENLFAYGRHLHLRTAVVFGGTSIRAQIQAMARGVHILVATPGRFMDLMAQGHIILDNVEVFVLDEADRMLDMGFVRDVKKIAAALPRERQTVLFSATMPKAVQGLANGLLTDPVRVEVAPAATTAEKIAQKILFVPKEKKRELMCELLKDEAIKRVLVFTRTKRGADRVAKFLQNSGVRADAIHGNKAQNARQRALTGFKSGRIRALVATDIAARGIDVDGVTHVINFELPDDPENYVHRIGRTARAGSSGIALSFCDLEERAVLRDIEKTIRQTIPVMEDQPYHSPEIASATGTEKRKSQGQKRPQGQKKSPGQKKPQGQSKNGKRKPASRRSRRPAAKAA